MSVFIQKLNPITGQPDWIVQNENYDYHQEVARASFADMLHDTERNQKYEAALKKAIAYMHSRGREANVLDIGTGTGLLSMMAVRNGADSVVACEAFKPMAECAKKVLELNDMSGKITLIPKRSTELVIGKDLTQKANILVTEVFDTELIGEGALSTFSHAHKELMESDCIVVPHSATIYAQIVESPIIQNWNRLKNVYNDDGEILLRVPDDVAKCPGSIAVHDIQLSQLPLELFNTIVSAKPVFQFDWSGKTPFLYDHFSVTTCKAERDGTAQAIFMWWSLRMDAENEIVLNCTPVWEQETFRKRYSRDVPWRDHWMQAVYYLPLEVKVRKFDELNLVSCHDEFSLWFNLKKDLQVTEIDYEKPQCCCNLHKGYSRTRIGQLNDGPRNKKFVSLLEEYVNRDTVLLILSHGFYYGLVAAKLGAKKIFFVEPNVVSKRFVQNFVAYNELGNVEILESVDALKKFDDKVNLVFGEPHFNSCILPWDNLLFFYMVKDAVKYCVDEVKIIPSKAVIKGVAVKFKDLQKIRSPLGTCEGFQMKPFDDLICTSSTISDDTVEAHPLWEYPGKALSNPVDIASLDYEFFRSNKTFESEGVLEIKGDDKCNGIALWVDWDTSNQRYSISTGPNVPIVINEEISWNMHVRQGVHLFHNVQNSSQIKYKFKLDSSVGHVIFNTY